MDIEYLVVLGGSERTLLTEAMPRVTRQARMKRPPGWAREHEVIGLAHGMGRNSLWATSNDMSGGRQVKGGLQAQRRMSRFKKQRAGPCWIAATNHEV